MPQHTVQQTVQQTAQNSAQALSLYALLQLDLSLAGSNVPWLFRGCSAS